MTVWDDAINALNMNKFIGLPDEQKADLMLRLKKLFAGLAKPFDTNLWESELTDLQSQIRTCLATEIVDRYITKNTRHDTEAKRIADVFRFDANTKIVSIAIIFPITVAFIVKNELNPPQHAKPSNLIFGSDFTADTLMKAVSNFNKKAPMFTCDVVHPHVDAALNAFEEEGIPKTLDVEMEAALAFIQAFTLAESYMDIGASIFDDNSNLKDIFEFINQIVFISNQICDAIEKNY